jgi:hypothetical protein
LLTISFVKTEFNLLAYGDIGQIDIFAKRNPGKLYKKSLEKKETPESAMSNVQKLLSEEKYSFKNNKCRLRIKGKKVKKTKEGYSNFNRLLCASSKYIKNSDQITILGDLVYAEFKGLPVKESMLVNKKVQTQMEKRVSCGIHWYRSMMKNYKKYCPKGSSAVHQRLWSRKANRLHTRYYILEGNHAFDVNYKIVSRKLASLSIAKALYVGSSKRERRIRKNDLHLHPRFISVRRNGLRIQFLDINTVILAALMDGGKGKVRSEKEYNDFCTKALSISKILPYKQALAYAKFTYKAMSKFSTRSHWRVIRSHHPPMNVEGGFADQDHFWSVKFQGTTFFKLMKQKKIKLWLASHHHSGHVMAYPYKKFDALKDKFNSKAMKAEKANCIYHQPKALHQNLKKQSTIKTSCPKKALNYNIKDNFNSRKGGYLWIIVTGNGGRELDDMEGSAKARSVLIWGRAVPNQYGAANLRFSKNNLKTTFFEVNQKGKSEDVAHFNFRNVKKATNYHLIDQEIVAKLKK